MKIKAVYIPLLLGVAAAIGVFVGAQLSNSPTGFGQFNQNRQKISRLINYIENDYVDDVNTDSIVDLTVTNILDNLDPHSTYIPKNQYQSVQQNMNGKFVGIGVSFFMINDTINVIRTIPGGPAEKNGIKAGDQILYANEQPLFGKTTTNNDVTKILKGKKGTRVELTIKSPNQKQSKKIKLKRDEVPLISVDAGFKIDQDLGYIKVNRFAKSTYVEFNNKLKTLVNQNISGLIIDLRDNGGGFLDQAIDICDELLPDDQPILITKSRNGDLDTTLAGNSGMFQKKPIYILINRRTASASEIVAGAIQDNDRGTIVGRRSFGKGLVQREMKLGDGSAVRLTIARYYTPTGRSIQRPYDLGEENYYNQYARREQNGELVAEDSIPINDSLRYTTPEGDTVYGGGGIVPDIFIPQDTLSLRREVDFMYKGGVMSRFIFDKLNEKRSYYQSLTADDIMNKNIFSDTLISDFTEYLEENNFDYDFKPVSNQLENALKATLAEQLINKDVATQIKLRNDQMILKVIENFKNR